MDLSGLMWISVDLRGPLWTSHDMQRSPINLIDLQRPSSNLHRPFSIFVLLSHYRPFSISVGSSLNGVWKRERRPPTFHLDCRISQSPLRTFLLLDLHCFFLYYHIARIFLALHMMHHPAPTLLFVTPPSWAMTFTPIVSVSLSPSLPLSSGEISWILDPNGSGIRSWAKGFVCAFTTSLLSYFFLVPIDQPTLPPCPFPGLSCYARRFACRFPLNPSVNGYNQHRLFVTVGHLSCTYHHRTVYNNTIFEGPLIILPPYFFFSLSFPLAKRVCLPCQPALATSLTRLIEAQ